MLLSGRYGTLKMNKYCMIFVMETKILSSKFNLQTRYFVYFEYETGTNYNKLLHLFRDDIVGSEPNVTEE